MKHGSNDIEAGGKYVDSEPGTRTSVTETTARNDQQGDFVTENEDRDLSRGLHQRHISLIAIAGAIGTGLFLGLGGSIQTAGPAGALLGYATVGLIVCAVQFALGEVCALLPVTGSFVRHAEFLVDPSMGFAIGWNIVCAHSLVWIGNVTDAIDVGLRELALDTSGNISNMCVVRVLDRYQLFCLHCLGDCHDLCRRHGICTSLRRS